MFWEYEAGQCYIEDIDNISLLNKSCMLMIQTISIMDKTKTVLHSISDVLIIDEYFGKTSKAYASKRLIGQVKMAMVNLQFALAVDAVLYLCHCQCDVERNHKRVVRAEL